MLYEFECFSCKTNFEEIKSYEERGNSTPCPKCGGASFKLISSPQFNIASECRDLNGNPIWFPKDGKPYKDVALRRTFNSAKEKKEWMDSKKIVMDGSESPRKYPEESGSIRDKSYRKQMRMED